MATKRQDGYLRNAFRWQSGRQQSGYEKMLLITNPFVLPFDIYVLRFKPGAEVPTHTDPVTDRRHFRLNVVLTQAKRGGEFVCGNPIFETRRIKLFRPDMSPHSVTRVEAGTRYVLSLGWIWGSTKQASM